MNENVSILIKVPLKFDLKGPIVNNPALVNIMVWHRIGDKPLSEPMLTPDPIHYLLYVSAVYANHFEIGY